MARSKGWYNDGRGKIYRHLRKINGAHDFDLDSIFILGRSRSEFLSYSIEKISVEKFELDFIDTFR